MRRQFTFYPRNCWYSFDRPWKDGRLSCPLNQPVALNPRPLDWGILRDATSSLWSMLESWGYFHSLKLKFSIFTWIWKTLFPMIESTFKDISFLGVLNWVTVHSQNWEMCGNYLYTLWQKGETCCHLVLK